MLLQAGGPEDATQIWAALGHQPVALVAPDQLTAPAPVQVCTASCSVGYTVRVAVMRMVISVQQGAAVQDPEEMRRLMAMLQPSPQAPVQCVEDVSCARVHCTVY